MWTCTRWLAAHEVFLMAMFKEKAEQDLRGIDPWRMFRGNWSFDLVFLLGIPVHVIVLAN